MKGKILAGLVAATGLVLGSLPVHASDSDSKSGSSGEASKNCALHEAKTEQLNGTVTGSQHNALFIQPSTGQQMSVLVTGDTAFLYDGKAVHGATIMSGDEVRAALVPVGEGQFFALAVNVEHKAAPATGTKEGKKAPSKASKEKKKAPKTGEDESNTGSGSDSGSSGSQTP